MTAGRDIPAALVLSYLPGLTPRRLLAARREGKRPETLLATRGEGAWTSHQVQAAGEKALRERDRADRLGVAFVAVDDPGYPALLREIPDPPIALRVRCAAGTSSVSGALPGSDGNAVAVVGARRADAYGKTVAELFATALSGAGVAVVSGLARGVDAAAHRAASAGSGRTLAVLGTGVDVVYPRDHAALAGQILDHGGALVSELPCGTGPERGHFPRRNRILAGLSRGALVVQAGERSGSLITARLALDYDRLVWAIPSRLGDPLGVGGLALLRAGAQLATEPRDILEDLAPLHSAVPSSSIPSLTAQAPRDPVLAALGTSGRTLEELTAITSRSRGDLLSQLLRFELDGLVAAEPGGIYRLTPATRPGLD